MLLRTAGLVGRQAQLALRQHPGASWQVRGSVSQEFVGLKSPLCHVITYTLHLNA
jgi:hypothetical protein